MNFISVSSSVYTVVHSGTQFHQFVLELFGVPFGLVSCHPNICLHILNRSIPTISPNNLRFFFEDRLQIIIQAFFWCVSIFGFLGIKKFPKSSSSNFKKFKNFKAHCCYFIHDNRPNDSTTFTDLCTSRKVSL